MGGPGRLLKRERVTGGGRNVRPAQVSPTAVTVPDTSYVLDDIIPTPVTART
jgi:hypothetical protein